MTWLWDASFAGSLKKKQALRVVRWTQKNTASRLPRGLGMRVTPGLKCAARKNSTGNPRSAFPPFHASRIRSKAISRYFFLGKNVKREGRSDTKIGTPERIRCNACANMPSPEHRGQCKDCGGTFCKLVCLPEHGCGEER